MSKSVAREFVVDARNEHGEPSVVGIYRVPPPSHLKLKDDKKVGKKRMKERQALKLKDQQKLQRLFTLPHQLELAKKERERRDITLEDAMKAMSLEEEPKSDEKGKEELQSDKRSTTDSKEVDIEHVIPSMYRRRSRVVGMWTLYLVLSVFFLAAAISPDLRAIFQHILLLAVNMLRTFIWQ